MQKHVAYPYCRYQHMNSQIYLGSSGGSMSKNYTYELFEMAQDKCYKNDT